MYKGNHNSPPNQHPSPPPHTPFPVFKVATVDCFTPTARIDELLLTGIRVRYWSVDKTLQITEKTLPYCLLRHVLRQCVVGNVYHLIPD